MMSIIPNSTLSGFWHLMRADKPIGTYLLLWPTLWGLLLAAQGFPGWHISTVFVLGVVLMRAAGCVINDFADRKFDGHVKRTKHRPLVTGQVTSKQALVLFATLCLSAFMLVLTLNLQTIVMSFAALALAFSYPFMKRFTYLPQFVLGAAYSFGIPMAFMAVLETIPWWAWCLYLANLLWTVAYDTMYAMVDRDDDLKIGIKSTAILFGQYDRLIIGLLQLMTLLLLTLVFVSASVGWLPFLALFVAGLLFLRQQWNIRHRERDACFQSFLDNNKVGLVIAVALLVEFLVFTSSGNLVI